MADNLPTDAAGADLQVPGAAATPEIAPMSYTEAADRKQRALADPQWRQRYMDGDVTAKAEMDAIVRGLSAQPRQATSPEDAEAMVDHLRSIVADFPEDVATQIRMGMSVTSNERRRVEQFWQQCLRDKGWMRRYLDGDRDAVRQKAMVDITLAAPVKDNPSQP